MHDSYLGSFPENDSDIYHSSASKGMKWGVRKSEYKSMSRKDRRKLRKRKNEGYSDHQRDLDKLRLGGKSVKRITNAARTKGAANRRNGVIRSALYISAMSLARAKSNPQSHIGGMAVAPAAWHGLARGDEDDEASAYPYGP